MSCVSLVSLLGAAAAASLSTSVSTALNTASARAPESQIRSNAGAGATWARVLRFGGVRARLTCNYDLRASAALLKERRLRGYFPVDASLSGALRTAAKNGRVVRYQLRHSPLSGASAVDLKTTAAGATLRAGLAAGDGLQELGVERGVGSHCFVAAAVHAKTRAGRLRLAARLGDGRDAVRKLAVDVGVRKVAGDPKLYNGVTWEGERVTALSYEVDTRDGREYGVTVRPAGGGRRGAVELQLVDERGRHAEAPAWLGRAPAWVATATLPLDVEAALKGPAISVKRVWNW